MNYFRTVDEKQLDNEFLIYLNDLMSYMNEELGIRDNYIIDMIFSKGCSFNSMADFFENSDRDLNRTLLAIVLKEFDYSYAKAVNRHNHLQHIYNVFSMLDYAYLETNGEPVVGALLSRCGISGVYNSFSVKDDQLKKDLVRILYPIIRYEELTDSNIQSPLSLLISRLMISAREMSISDTSSYSEVGHELDLPSSIKVIFLEEFFSASKSLQSSIINEAAINSIESAGSKIVTRESIASDYKILAARWPVEFIRSRVIAGDDPVKACEKASSVISILLENAEIYGSELEEVMVNIKKSALFPFPDDFKKVFGDNFLDMDIAINSIKINDSNEFMDEDLRSFPYWVGVDFTHESISGAMTSRSVDAFHAYNYPQKLDFKQAVVENMNRFYFSYQVMRGSLLDDPETYSDLLDIYLDRISKDNPGAFSSGLKNIHNTILNRAVDSLSTKYNDFILKFFLDYPDYCDKNLKLVIGNDDIKRNTINLINKLDIPLTGHLIRAGKFSPGDFTDKWSKTESHIKKLFMNNDLGI